MSDDLSRVRDATGEQRIGDVGASPRALAHDELKRTFDYQVHRIREIDSKAIEILKANLLLIGIVVTGASILAQTDLAIRAFLNEFTVMGGLLLLASTGLAAVTYTASNLRGGLDSHAAEMAIVAHVRQPEATDSESEFERQLLRSYGRWIDYNARVTAVNDILVTITVLLVFVAFVYVVAGVSVAAIGLPRLQAAVAFVLLTACMSSFTWIAYHMDHIGAEDLQGATTFEGIRLSKGLSRKDGLQTVRAMVGWSRK